MVLPVGGRKPGIPDRTNFELNAKVNVIERVANRADTRVFDVRAYGAVGDGVTDDTDTINAAIAAASAAGGGTIFFPAGTYLVSPVTNTRFLTVASNITYAGVGYASHIKVKDDAGNYYAVFHPATSGTRVENVMFFNLRINQNVANQTDATDPFGLSGQASQHAIAVRNAANIIVKDCWFDECCGINTVYINGDGYSDVKGFRVQDCMFRWLPLPNAANPTPEHVTYDNSAVYIVGSDAVVTGNMFSTPLVEGVPAGARGACEFHGPKMVFANNLTENYQTLINLGGLMADDRAAEWVVDSNSGYNLNNGIRIGANGIAETNDRIRVVNNDLHLDTSIHGLNTGSGIVVHSGTTTAGPITMLDISHNTIFFEPDTRTTTWDGANLSIPTYFQGIGVSLGSTIRGGVISDNVIVNCPVYPLRLGGSSTVFQQVQVQRNVIDTPGHMDTWTTNRFWIRMQGDFINCDITDNVLIDTRDASAGQRVWLNAQNIGTCRNTWVDRNYRKDTGVGTWSTASTFMPAGLWSNIYRSFSRATIDPPEIAAGSEYTTTITHGGATTADTVTATPSGALENGLAYFARVSAADTITLHIRNYTSSAINPASRTWRFQLHRAQQDQG